MSVSASWNDPDPALLGDLVFDSKVEADFRQAMRRHAAGVCVLSSGEGEAITGMVVTAVTSFSMDPPSLLVCVNDGASVAPLIRQSRRFAVSLLGPDHADVVETFCRAPSGPERFAKGDWRRDEADAPWLADAVAHITCEVVAETSFGTHTALVGRVRAVRLGPASSSLVFRDGVYGPFGQTPTA